MGSDDGVEILEAEVKESWLERAMGMPGAISSVFILSILLPWIGFTKHIIWPMMVSFSVPVFYIFLTMVVLNRHISLRKHIPILIGVSLILYLVSMAPSTPSSLYIYITLFLIGLGISSLTYFIYYFLYRLGKRMWGMEEIKYRKRFLIAFLPSIFLMLLILFFISGIVIGVEGEEIITVAGWLVKITGGL